MSPAQDFGTLGLGRKAGQFTAALLAHMPHSEIPASIQPTTARFQEHHFQLLGTWGPESCTSSATQFSKGEPLTTPSKDPGTHSLILLLGIQVVTPLSVLLYVENQGPRASPNQGAHPHTTAPIPKFSWRHQSTKLHSTPTSVPIWLPVPSWGGG